MLDRFLTPTLTDRPMLLEVFTDYHDESDALQDLNTMEISTKEKTKQAVKNLIGADTAHKLKKLIKG